MSVIKDNQILKGVVRIVRGRKELSKIEKGDIIVSPMTTPEYTSILKKVKAIITDEGGITCHAAIIARELKIPTLIGTKIGSKILKDNDLVEVNASNGFARKLGKK